MTSVRPRLDRRAAASSVSSICMPPTTRTDAWLFPVDQDGADGSSFSARRLHGVTGGYGRTMVVLVILIILALVFGVGAVLEGLAWAFLIGLVLLLVAAWWGWSKVRGVTRRR